MEECDGLQGLQVVTGVDDAWGGWAARWMERLRDEFRKSGIWVWGVGGQGASPGVSRVSVGSLLCECTSFSGCTDWVGG